MGRVQPKVKEQEPAGAYFLRPSSNLTFIPSGCTLLDCALGGGWVVGRMSNIIGDTSTSKTGLAVEAAANFRMLFPKAPIYYRESEGAFDIGYARMMGFPKDAHFWADDYDEPLESVEDVFEDIKKILDNHDGKQPILYVVDSWDGLSDRAELERELGKATYGQDKAKQASRGFRQMIKRVEDSRMCLLIVSQVRDAIGITFGETKRRSGGKALDFYASHCLWLARIEIENEKHQGVDRATGIVVRARCKKNKTGMPFRECDFTYRLGYGIDDAATTVNWLADIGRLDLLGIKHEKQARGKTSEERKEQKGAKQRAVTTFLKSLDKLPEDEYREYVKGLSQLGKELWYEIDQDFVPTRRKYG